jgi:hypothetical protein
MPNYAIYARTYAGRSPLTHGGELVKLRDKYHLVDLDATDELSICGNLVDHEFPQPALHRWDTLKDERCDVCEVQAGAAARKQAEREPIHWDFSI